MTWYSPASNIYSNQMQYYNPYNYSSYHMTQYGIMTDGSFRNHYYALDGVNKNSGGKNGWKTFVRFAAPALKLASAAFGGDFSDSNVTGNIFPTTMALTSISL